MTDDWLVSFEEAELQLVVPLPGAGMVRLGGMRSRRIVTLFLKDVRLRKRGERV